MSPHSRANTGPGRYIVVFWKEDEDRDLDTCARLTCNNSSDVIYDEDAFSPKYPPFQAGLCSDCIPLVSEEGYVLAKKTAPRTVEPVDIWAEIDKILSARGWTQARNDGKVFFVAPDGRVLDFSLDEDPAVARAITAALG